MSYYTYNINNMTQIRAYELKKHFPWTSHKILSFPLCSSLPFWSCLDERILIIIYKICFLYLEFHNCRILKTFKNIDHSKYEKWSLEVFSYHLVSSIFLMHSCNKTKSFLLMERSVHDIFKILKLIKSW